MVFGMELLFPTRGQNQTILGLKYRQISIISGICNRQNQTILGLKSITLKSVSYILLCQNQTILGLKSGYYSFKC